MPSSCYIRPDITREIHLLVLQTIAKHNQLCPHLRHKCVYTHVCDALYTRFTLFSCNYTNQTIIHDQGQEDYVVPRCSHHYWCGFEDRTKCANVINSWKANSFVVNPSNLPIQYTWESWRVYIYGGDNANAMLSLWTDEGVRISLLSLSEILR